MPHTSGMVKVKPYYDELKMTGEERDELIVKLRNAGWSYRDVGAQVGMSANGVMHALRRIADGRRGRNPRD